MKLFLKTTLLAVFLLPAMLMAAVSNLQLLTPRAIPSGGDVRFSYTSDRDTVRCPIYIEADGNTALDTTKDALFYYITQFDNNTASNFQDKSGILGDGNDTLHRFLYYIPNVDLPPGLYWVNFHNEGAAGVADTFRMLPVANPYRTITGKVTPPAGQSKATIFIKADIDNRRFSAFTDTAGNYTVYIDSVTVVTSVDTAFRVKVDMQFPGYMNNPVERAVNVKAGSVSNVNFGFDAITAGVQGLLLCGTDPVPNVSVYLRDSATRVDGQPVRTDAAGAFVLGATAGTWDINSYTEDLMPLYLQPQGVTVHVVANQFVDTVIQVVRADTVVYGRITKEGGKPGGLFKLELMSNEGNSEAAADTNGYFALPASTLSTSYRVRVRNWDKDFDTIPAGYILEGGNELDVLPGDSALINMIPAPAGAVVCTVGNTSSIPCNRIHINVWSYDSLTQERGKSAGSLDQPFAPGPYVIPNIGNGVYVLDVSLGNGFNPTDWRLVSTVESAPGVDKFFVVNDDTAYLALVLTNDDSIVPMGLSKAADGSPKAFALCKPAPMPFNPSVTIGFDMPRRALVSLDVFDISGRQVAQLVSGIRAIGHHQVTWAARSSDNSALASGVYIVRMQSGVFTARQRLVYIR